MTKGYEPDSIDAAAYIAKQCAIKNYYIDLTKLQKILFACCAASLVVTGRRLCSEQPKTWHHGPVFPKVYDFTIRHPDFIQALLNRKERMAQAVGAEFQQALDCTIKFFSHYRPGQLVKWSLQKGSPWDVATAHGQFLKVTIPDEAILPYFKSILRKTDAEPQ